MTIRSARTELQRLILKTNPLVGFYNGSTFVLDRPINGITSLKSDEIEPTSNNAGSGLAFWNESSGQWLVVTEAKVPTLSGQNLLLTKRRRRSGKEEIEYLAEYLLNTNPDELPFIRFIFDDSGSLDYFKPAFNTLVTDIIENTLTPIYGEEQVAVKVSVIEFINEEYIRWAYDFVLEKETTNCLIIAFINESSPVYHTGAFGDLIRSGFINQFNILQSTFSAYTPLERDAFNMLIYAVEPLENFDLHLAAVESTYNLEQDYNILAAIVAAGITPEEVQDDFLQFLETKLIAGTTFYLINPQGDFSEIIIPETIIDPEADNFVNVKHFLEPSHIVLKWGSKPETDPPEHEGIIIYNRNTETFIDYRNPTVPSNTQLPQGSWRGDETFWQSYLIDNETREGNPRIYFFRSVGAKNYYYAFTDTRENELKDLIDANLAGDFYFIICYVNENNEVITSDRLTIQGNNEILKPIKQHNLNSIIEADPPLNLNIVSTRGFTKTTRLR